MNKIMGLLMTIFVGFPLTVISMIISWWMNEGMDKGQPDNDSDLRLYIPSWCRSRRSNDRHDKGDEK